MNLFHNMKIFKRVAEIESFTKVANETGVSQSAISKYISALESRLGVKLINRSTRHLTLSEEGHEYYQRCCSILSDLEEAEALISTGQTVVGGLLKINIPDTFGRLRILPYIWEFLEKYPDVKMDIMMDDRRVDLVKEGVDVAIRSGFEFDPTLITRKLCYIPRLLAASPDYIERNGIPRSIDDIKTHECIIHSLSSKSQTWDFVNSDKIKKIRINGRMRVSSPETSVIAAQKGLGITLSPEWLVKKSFEDKSLIPVLENCEPVAFEVHAIFPERRYIAARVRYFVDYISEKLTQQ